MFSESNSFAKPASDDREEIEFCLDNLIQTTHSARNEADA